MTTTEAEGIAGSPVYCAGPMFSIADTGEQAQIAKKVEDSGFTTYLPQRDGIEVAKVMDTITTGLNLPNSEVADIMAFARKIVFALDIYQLVERCQSLVFTMDGRVPDEGMVVEASIGFASAKPMVAFKTTPITILGGYDNPMVQGLTTNWTYVNNLDDIPARLSAVVAARAALGKHGSRPGVHLRPVIALGKDVWGEIDLIHQVANATPEEVYAAVQQLEAKWATALAKAFPPQG